MRLELQVLVVEAGEEGQGCRRRGRGGLDEARRVRRVRLLCGRAL